MAVLVLRHNNGFFVNQHGKFSHISMNESQHKTKKLIFGML